MDKQTNRHGFKFKDSSVGYSTKLVCTCKPESDVMKRVERLNSEVQKKDLLISELSVRLNKTKAKLELERVETRELKEKVDSQTKIIIKQYDVELSNLMIKLKSSQFLEKQAAWDSQSHELDLQISELRAQLNEAKAKLELERVETRELKEQNTKINRYDVELSKLKTKLKSLQTRALHHEQHTEISDGELILLEKNSPAVEQASHRSGHSRVHCCVQVKNTQSKHRCSNYIQFLEKQAAWDSQSHERDLQISELRAQLNEAKAKLELERVETRELKEQNTTIIKQYDVELSNLKTKLKSSQDEERAKTHALEALTKKLEEKEVEHQKLKHVVEKKFEETNLVVESSVKKCFTEMKERNIELENKNSQLQSYIDNIQHVVEKKFEETNLVVESVKKGFTEMKERNTELENKNSQLQSYIDNTQDRECSSSLGEEFEQRLHILTDSVRAALNQTRKRPIQKSVGRTVGRTRRKKPLQ